MHTLTARSVALFALALGLALPLAAQPGPPTPREFRIVRSDPMLDQVVASDARRELIGDRFGLTEGPVWVPDGDDGRLLYSDLNSNVSHRWAPPDPLGVY